MENEFPQRLRKLRERMGFTRKTLAELCGVTYRTFRNYEEGKTIPDLNVMVLMTVYLKCTLFDLTGM